MLGVIVNLYFVRKMADICKVSTFHHAEMALKPIVRYFRYINVYPLANLSNVTLCYVSLLSCVSVRPIYCFFFWKFTFINFEWLPLHSALISHDFWSFLLNNGFFHLRLRYGASTRREITRVDSKALGFSTQCTLRTFYFDNCEIFLHMIIVFKE